MKTKITISLLALTIHLTSFNGLAQVITKLKPSLTVLSIDVENLMPTLTASQMGNLVRIELEKLDTFEVMDRYDVAYMVQKNKPNMA